MSLMESNAPVPAPVPAPGSDDCGMEKSDEEKTTSKDDPQDEKKNAQDQDVLYVQDVGFNVTVSVSGLDQFSIQVRSNFPSTMIIWYVK